MALLRQDRKGVDLGVERIAGAASGQPAGLQPFSFLSIVEPWKQHRLTSQPNRKTCYDPCRRRRASRSLLSLLKHWRGALFHQRDSRHERVLAFSLTLTSSDQLRTTDAVLTEVLAMFSGRRQVFASGGGPTCACPVIRRSCDADSVYARSLA